MLAPAFVNADDVAGLIQPNDRVALHKVVMTPDELVDALIRRAGELS